LLIAGLLIGETLHHRFGWPKIIGYVLAGTMFGPACSAGSTRRLLRARPLADAALGLLMMEVGRRLDLGWMRRNPELIRSSATDIGLSFLLIFGFAHFIVGLAPVWAAATAAVTMASAPTVVMLVIEDSRAQGQVSERMILHTAISAAASFIAFASCSASSTPNAAGTGASSPTRSGSPPAPAGGGLCSWLALRIARSAQALAGPGFHPVACAMLAVGWRACWRCRSI
jgi:Kef-type K+ transport system membrane component KefB